MKTSYWQAPRAAARRSPQAFQAPASSLIARFQAGAEVSFVQVVSYSYATAPYPVARPDSGIASVHKDDGIVWCCFRMSKQRLMIYCSGMFSDTALMLSGPMDALFPSRNGRFH